MKHMKTQIIISGACGLLQAPLLAGPGYRFTGAYSTDANMVFIQSANHCV